jgi:hypothetical protein
MSLVNREHQALKIGVALTSFIGAALYAKSTLAKPKTKTTSVKNQGGTVEVKPEAKLLTIDTEQIKVVPKDQERVFSESDLIQNDRAGIVYHQAVGSYIEFGGYPTRLLVAPTLVRTYFDLYMNEIQSPYRTLGDIVKSNTLNNRNSHYVGYSQQFDLDVRFKGSNEAQLIKVRRPLWAIHASDTGVRIGRPLKFFESKLNKYICAMLFAEGLLKGPSLLGGHQGQQPYDLATERTAMANVFMLRLYDAINAFAVKNKTKKLDDLTEDNIDTLCKELFLGADGKGTSSPWSREGSFAPNFKKMLNQYDKTNKDADIERPFLEFKSFENSFLWRTPILTPNCRHFIHPESMTTTVPTWIKGPNVKNVYIVGKTIFSEYAEKKA